MVNIYGSNRSFNVVERPFSHDVKMKVNPNAWKELDLKKKIAQLIMVRINGKFYAKTFKTICYVS